MGTKSKDSGMPRIPSTVYGRWVGSGDDRYFSADPEAESLIDDKGDTEIIGVYNLVGFVKVTNTTVVWKLDNKPKRAGGK